MRYFVENADYTGNELILYDENALTEYALKVYDKCEDTQILAYYVRTDLYYYETALKFLNDRFSNDDTPFANCVIIHLSNG